MDKRPGLGLSGRACGSGGGVASSCARNSSTGTAMELLLVCECLTASASQESIRHESEDEQRAPSRDNRKHYIRIVCRVITISAGGTTILHFSDEWKQTIYLFFLRIFIFIKKCSRIIYLENKRWAIDYKQYTIQDIGQGFHSNRNAGHPRIMARKFKEVRILYKQNIPMYHKLFLNSFWKAMQYSIFLKIYVYFCWKKWNVKGKWRHNVLLFRK